jgi:hypothetical protein
MRLSYPDTRLDSRYHALMEGIPGWVALHMPPAESKPINFSWPRACRLPLALNSPSIRNFGFLDRRPLLSFDSCSLKFEGHTLASDPLLAYL